MGRRWQCEWRHSEEEVFQAYHQATDARLLPRLQALWHLRRGRSLTDVAMLTGGRIGRCKPGWRGIGRAG